MHDRVLDCTALFLCFSVGHRHDHTCLCGERDSVNIKGQDPSRYQGEAYGRGYCCPGTKKGLLAQSQTDTFTGTRWGRGQNPDLKLGGTPARTLILRVHQRASFGTQTKSSLPLLRTLCGSRLQRQIQTSPSCEKAHTPASLPSSCTRPQPHHLPSVIFMCLGQD